MGTVYIPDIITSSHNFTKIFTNNDFRNDPKLQTLYKQSKDNTDGLEMICVYKSNGCYSLCLHRMDMDGIYDSNGFTYRGFIMVQHDKLKGVEVAMSQSAEYDDDQKHIENEEMPECDDQDTAEMSTIPETVLDSNISQNNSNDSNNNNNNNNNTSLKERVSHFLW